MKTHWLLGAVMASMISTSQAEEACWPGVESTPGTSMALLIAMLMGMQEVSQTLIVYVYHTADVSENAQHSIDKGLVGALLCGDSIMFDLPLDNVEPIAVYFVDIELWLELLERSRERATH